MLKQRNLEMQNAYLWQSLTCSLSLHCVDAVTDSVDRSVAAAAQTEKQLCPHSEIINKWKFDCGGICEVKEADGTF